MDPVRSITETLGCASPQLEKLLGCVFNSQPRCQAKETDQGKNEQRIYEEPVTSPDQETHAKNAVRAAWPNSQNHRQMMIS